jgi:broad specificity phosphatase PhoE
MTEYLILVKHSLPEIQEELPAREWKLSDEGRIRAGRLAERLIEYQPDVVVSSSESKAMETAKIIADKLKVEFHVMNGLYEHDRHTTPYLSKADFEHSIQEFFANPALLVFGSETADQAHQRFAQAVHSILESHKDKTVVIVAHGTVISLLVSRLTGLSDLSLWKELGLPSFIVIDRQSNILLTKENIV